MGRYGLLIDYKYCCGCHTCEVACQKEHGYEPGIWGIHLMQEGPWRLPDSKKMQYDFLPFPTELCDLCEDRVARGKRPACAHNCEAACITYGPIAQLAAQMDEAPNQVLFVK